MEQHQQEEQSYFVRLYLFLRDRDARIIELFFLGLNLYILLFVLIPPYTHQGIALYSRVAFQLLVTIINLLALTSHIKSIRVTSAIANASIMALISTALVRNASPHAGTYILIALLATFVCWKINIRQE